MSYTYIDREGFEWDKLCTLCDRFSPNGKPIGDSSTKKDTRTYCRAYDVYFTEEPFSSYYNARTKQNDCPEFHKSC
jgi:hypothetical protein